MLQNYFILQCSNQLKQQTNYYLCDESYLEDNEIFSVVQAIKMNFPQRKNKFYSVKKLKINGDDHSYYKDRFFQEQQLMSIFSKLYSQFCFYRDLNFQLNGYYVIMPNNATLTLKTIAQQKKEQRITDEEQIFNFFRFMIINYIQPALKHKYILNCLKLGNICTDFSKNQFFQIKMIYKIFDFSQSIRFNGEPNTENQITLPKSINFDELEAPPEVRQLLVIPNKYDMFSLGVLGFLLHYGDFETVQQSIRQYKNEETKELVFPERVKINGKLKRILLGLLQFYPQSRFSCSELLEFLNAETPDKIPIKLHKPVSINDTLFDCYIANVYTGLVPFPQSNIQKNRSHKKGSLFYKMCKERFQKVFSEMQWSISAKQKETEKSICQAETIQKQQEAIKCLVDLVLYSESLKAEQDFLYDCLFQYKHLIHSFFAVNVYIWLTSTEKVIAQHQAIDASETSKKMDSDTLSMLNLAKESYLIQFAAFASEKFLQQKIQYFQKICKNILFWLQQEQTNILQERALKFTIIMQQNKPTSQQLIYQISNAIFTYLSQILLQTPFTPLTQGKIILVKCFQQLVISLKLFCMSLEEIDIKKLETFMEYFEAEEFINDRNLFIVFNQNLTEAVLMDIENKKQQQSFINLLSNTQIQTLAELYYQYSQQESLKALMELYSKYSQRFAEQKLIVLCTFGRNDARNLQLIESLQTLLQIANEFIKIKGNLANEVKYLSQFVSNLQDNKSIQSFSQVLMECFISVQEGNQNQLNTLIKQLKALLI